VTQLLVRGEPLKWKKMKMKISILPYYIHTYFCHNGTVYEAFPSLPRHGSWNKIYTEDSYRLRGDRGQREDLNRFTKD
jgi:hypothetical protein